MGLFDALDAAPIGVRRTRELERVVAVPRRVLSEATTPDLTGQFLVAARCDDPACDLCDGGRRDARLTWVQSAALREAREQRGALLPLPVGSGKTLVGLLLPEVMLARRAVLIVPAQTYRQIWDRQIPMLSKHFRLALDRTEIVPVSKLQVSKHAKLLEDLQPDLAVVDEIHCFRHSSSTRTKRFLHYMRRHPSCLLVGMSGTLTGSKLLHWAHLAEMALRERSPLPRDFREVEEWGQGIDEETDERIDPGAILTEMPERCAAPGCTAPATHRHVEDPDAIGPHALCETHAGLGARMPPEVLGRRAVRQRYRETAGIVWSEASGCASALICRKIRRLPIPDAIVSLARELKRTWVLEDEEIEDGAAMARILKQLSLGFHYRWRWPNGKDHVWLAARRDWHRAVREYLAHAARPGFDSELLLRQAVARGDTPGLASAWRAWDAVRGRFSPTPPVETVWVSDFAVRAAAAWLERAGGDPDFPTGAVVWYEHTGFEEALRALVPHVYGAGENVEVNRLAAAPPTERIRAAFSLAHSTGKNLQRWGRALVVSPPSSAKTVEQLIGRHHRQGQRLDEVEIDWWAHTYAMSGAIQSAVDEARAAQQLDGTKQKILAATWIEEE